MSAQPDEQAMFLHLIIRTPVAPHVAAAKVLDVVATCLPYEVEGASWGELTPVDLADEEAIDG